MNSCIISIANSNDAAMIAAFSRQAFLDSFSSFNSRENMEKFMQDDFNIQKLIAQVGEPGNIFLLAHVDHEFCGYARLLEGDKPPELDRVEAIELSRIYVEHKIKAKGIGSAILNTCIDIAREKSKEAIWLGVWEHNLRAISFYEKFGFEIFGDHIFMLGEDAQTDLLMKKNCSVQG